MSFARCLYAFCIRSQFTPISFVICLSQIHDGFTCVESCGDISITDTCQNLLISSDKTKKEKEKKGKKNRKVKKEKEKNQSYITYMACCIHHAYLPCLFTADPFSPQTSQLTPNR